MVVVIILAIILNKTRPYSVTEFIEFLGNHYMLTSAWVILFILLVASWISGATSKIKTINTHDMTMLINRENGRIVDIRKAAEFNKGHITDAVNLTTDKINSGNFGKLEKHKADPIIVVCNAGISAKAAALTLSKAGFENVSLLQGGMQTWVGANLPVVSK